jgi:hypothetical protein
MGGRKGKKLQVVSSKNIIGTYEKGKGKKCINFFLAKKDLMKDGRKERNDKNQTLNLANLAF